MNLPYKQQTSSHTKGFSLTELVLAILIIVVAMMPVFDMVSGARRNVASVEEETIAFSLASESIEWMRALSYEDLQYRLPVLQIFPEGSLDVKKNRKVFLENPVKSYEVGKSTIQYEPSTQFKIFQRRTTVFDVDPGSKSIKVQVVVSWKARLELSKSGQDHEVKLEFLSFPL